MQLPPELAFLSPFFVEPSETYRTAIWLLSDFDEQVWEYSFDYKVPKQLDWRLTLEDGSLLTAPKNNSLLRGLKYYLTCSTRDAFGPGETNELKGAMLQRFCHACHIVDYLLVNAKRYQLGTYGLEGVTGGNLIEMLDKVASTPLISESVYNWKERLREFCMGLLHSSNVIALDAVIQNKPSISIITPAQLDEDSLEVPHELIPRIRAALYLNNLYHKQIGGNQPNTTLISKLVYPETLWGKNQAKITYDILCYNDESVLFEREYPPAPVTSGLREKMRDSTYAMYRRAIYNLGVLHEIPVAAPTINALQQAEHYTPDLSTTGRFRTLPSDVVFRSLQHAIEFHLDHGRDLTKAFCRIALECEKRGSSPASLTNEEVQAIVGEKLRKFGITQLSMATRSFSYGSYQLGVNGQKIDYFSKLRNNHGLYELIAVYAGAVQLTVGVLMARRVSELYMLKSEDCLDETEQWLLFMNAKSTRHLFGLRHKEARPIEPIAVDMIKTLIRMQKILVRIGYIPNLKTLFAVPEFKGAKKITDSSAYLYNRNLDLFCDYFEMPLNAKGQRYYLRQHQLRRFFAMLFFYCGSFAKLDTLQWMMGHADPKHVYRYIIESTDGAVLAGAKAHFAAERIIEGDDDNFQDLAQLLQTRYGTRDFTTVDAHDLEDQIQELVLEGFVEIEPEFFTDHQGKKFKIVARLKRTPETA
ncbi:integrase [Pseudomonas viridiflava]|uniref:integrase n=1 Tax=Pseudomonas viridiflava TaxID=33069 RepID=UPI001303529C|nr:integrase [Pseudomonas viridiflava]